MLFNDGILEIDGEKFRPGYTFEDFKKSKFYSNQDGILVIHLKNSYLIGNHNFLISLAFRFGYLELISLCCIDIYFSFEDAPEHKKFHDYILKQNGMDERTVFEWGNVTSTYDPKGNCSDIDIFYRNEKNKDIW